MANGLMNARWQMRALFFALALVIGVGALASAASAGRAPRPNPQGVQPVSQGSNGVVGTSGGNGGAAPAQSDEHAARDDSAQPGTTTVTTNNGSDGDMVVGMTDSGAGAAPASGNRSGNSSDAAPARDQSNGRPARAGSETTTTSAPASADTADAPSDPQSTAATSGSCLSSNDVEMLTLINNYRAENGVGPLTASPTLTDAAQYHAADMADQNYFSHDVQGVGSWSDNISNTGYDSMGRGENIAAGNTDPEATFQQWVNSPGHRANMLNPSYTAIGIGDASNSNSEYGTYWTTTFGDTVDAPACSG